MKIKKYNSTKPYANEAFFYLIHLHKNCSLIKYSIKTTFTLLITRAIKRSLFGRSLCFVRLLQSVVPPSVPQTLHSTKKTQQLKKKQLYFFCCSFLIFTRSLPFVRQGLCIHNTASFRYTPQATFLCIPAVLCLPPFIFSAVAPSHSHQGWHRSVKTSLCPKSRYAKRLTYIFSLPLHATILSLHFAKASFRSQSSVAVRLPQHRQLRSSFITLKFRYRYI